MAEGDNIVEQAEEQVKKIPTPVIIVGVVVLAGIAYLLIFKPGSGSASSTGPILPTIGGSGGGSDTSGISTPVPGVSGATSNADWLNNAINAVSQATGLDPYLVSVYLTQYLQGTSPSSNANASTAFQKAVNSALQLFGAPPSPITATPGSGSFFKSASDWLSAGLSEIGASNYNAAYASEITNFLQGNTTSLSSGAAALYQQISGLFGNAPGVGSYTVAPGTTTPPPASGLPTLVTSAQISQWQNLYSSLINTTPGGPSAVTAQSAFSSWINALNQIIPGASSLSQVQLANVFNLINTSAASPNSPFKNPDYVLTFINNLLANPGQYNQAVTTLKYYTGSGLITSAFGGPSTPGLPTNPTPPPLATGQKVYGA